LFFVAPTIESIENTEEGSEKICEKNEESTTLWTTFERRFSEKSAEIWDQEARRAAWSDYRSMNQIKETLEEAGRDRVHHKGHYRSRWSAT